MKNIYDFPAIVIVMLGLSCPNDDPLLALPLMALGFGLFFIRARLFAFAARARKRFNGYLIRLFVRRISGKTYGN